MNAAPLIITLDGPAGVGKSTLARRLAAALKIAYLDTGAMFRCLALALKRARLEAPDGAGAEQDELRGIFAELRFELRGAGGEERLFCKGAAPGAEIRTEEAGLLASRIAARPLVRALMKEAQRSLGARASLVAEGRDMGTEVFPHARYKFFLDADPDVRALRRLRELEARGEKPDPASLAAGIRERDRQDRERANAPLRPAPDAVLVDTSHLDIDGVFAALTAHIR